VHTRSVPDTLTRIINVFPHEERLQIAATLLSGLRLIISQRLYPHPSGQGRTALREYLAFTPEVRETLLDAPLERMTRKADELLRQHGQTIQQAAQQAYDQGNLLRENYVAVMAERKDRKEKQQGNGKGSALYQDRSLAELFAKFLEFMETAQSG
jgi:defect-in-organelle-trafficking protein DotB